MAVLHRDVSDIGVLGSCNWTVFDVFWIVLDPQRDPSRLIAGGGHHVLVFFCLLGSPWVSFVLP